MSCKIAQVDENGNLILDCNDVKYIRCLIDGLTKAQQRGDKQRVVDFSRELEKFKTLCGTNPLLDEFERTLKYVSDSLDLNSCKVVQRALQPTPQQEKKSKRRFTMRGFDVYEIHEDGSLTFVRD